MDTTSGNVIVDIMDIVGIIIPLLLQTLRLRSDPELEWPDLERCSRSSISPPDNKLIINILSLNNFVRTVFFKLWEMNKRIKLTIEGLHCFPSDVTYSPFPCQYFLPMGPF
jgi:hypothetical protein